MPAKKICKFVLKYCIKINLKNSFNSRAFRNLLEEHGKRESEREIWNVTHAKRVPNVFPSSSLKTKIIIANRR